jgi:hypothetical protein
VKERLVRLICLCFATVATYRTPGTANSEPTERSAPIAADTSFLSVGTSSEGSVYWRGNHLDPPYRVEIGFIPARDTVWLGAFVNRLPLRTTYPPVGSGEPFDTTRTNRHHAVLQEGADRWRAEGWEAAPRDTQLIHQALIYSAYHGVVDTAYVIGKGSILIRWRDSPIPYTIMYPPSSRALPHQIPGMSSATEMVRSLQQASLIIIGRGVTTAPQGARRTEVEAEIDDLTHARPHTPRYIILREDIADFVSPKSVDEILRGSGK